MSELCVTRVRAVHSPTEAVEDKDIVVCATSAKTPVFDGRLVGEGTHLNVVGSNWPHKAEIDPRTVRTADAIVCDDVEACRLEAGDLLAAVEEGAAEWSGMVSLADVVAGRATGRAVPEDVTLFKSVGLAIEDLALAAKLLELAAAEKLGTPLPF
jgi:ornithine cyclodeaminase/alanine dehydrogenase-like protein (mu-crystallin family)